MILLKIIGILLLIGLIYLVRISLFSYIGKKAMNNQEGTFDFDTYGIVIVFTPVFIYDIYTDSQRYVICHWVVGLFYFIVISLVAYMFIEMIKSHKIGKK
jgi:nitric oxide reductase large subunit